MRQYSLSQTIPTNVLLTPDEHKRLHKLKKGRNVNWLMKNASYIQHWQSRNEFFINGQIIQNFRASAEYMNWYWERTVVYIVNPNATQKPGFRNRAARMEVLMEGMGRMHREQGNWAPGNEVSQIPQRYMDQVGATHRMFIEPLHYPTEQGPFPGPPPPPVQSLRRQRRRNVVPPNEGQPSIHIRSPSFHAGSSSSYRPIIEPSMHEVPGPSNEAEVSQMLPDLNSITEDEMFSLLNEQTPMESVPYETGFFSPQIRQEPPTP